MKSRLLITLITLIGSATAFSAAATHNKQEPQYGSGGMMVGTLQQRSAASIHDALIADSVQTVVMPLKQSDIAIEMIPGVISADVRQLFFNDCNEYIEANYMFPLPADATISEMVVTINEERVIRSVVQERKQAQQTYETAKKAGKRTALLNRDTGNMLTMKIANLAPGDSAEVHLVYFQTTSYDNGVYRLTVPTVIAPQYIPREVREDSATVPSFNLESVFANLQAPRLPPGLPSDHHFSFSVTFSGMELQQVTSPSHAIAMAGSADPRVTTITLADTLNYPDRDVVIEIAVKDPEGVCASFLTSELGGAFYTIASVVPPFEIAPVSQRAKRSVIFVIDTSGSMDGDALVQAKLGIISSLKYLKPEDLFTIIEFNSDFHVLIEDAAAHQENLNRAASLISALEAEGGTEFLPVIEYALAKRTDAGVQRLIVFLTDGQSSQEDEVLRKIMADKSGSKIFPVGIGSSPNVALLQKMAEMGRGCLTTLADLKGISDSIEILFSKLQNPVMTDIAAQLVDESGAPIQCEIYPALFPDVFAGLPVKCTIRHNTLKDVYLQLSGNVAGITQELRYKLPEQPVGTAAVAQIFGQAQIMDLESLLLIAQNDDERQLLEGALLQSALDYQLVTRRTSRVAVEELVEKLSDGTLRYVPVPLHTAGKLESTATDDLALLISGCCLLAMGVALMRAAGALCQVPVNPARAGEQVE